MAENSNKWLCIGGSEHGKWIEKNEFHEVYPYEGNFLRPHIYRPRNLLNPQTRKNEYFYVLTTIDDIRASELLERELIDN